jgi:hypothetical protein
MKFGTENPYTIPTTKVSFVKISAVQAFFSLMGINEILTVFSRLFIRFG